MINPPDVSKKISIIIPVHNASSTLVQCLDAIKSVEYPSFETILVDDCSTDASMDIARNYPVKVLSLDGGPYGPGFARNKGAEAADGTILFFVDSDVLVKPDTLQKVADAFSQHPEISALFGSYDETPGSGEFLSQYKNLVHHFVHQQSREEAVTFWSGCGAIYKVSFLKLGGFDFHKYPRPSIEDIELGYRLTMSGQQIALIKDIQVTHLKRWSLVGLIKTDVFSRAIPWTRLIMEDRNLPNDLNLSSSQRLSALLILLMMAFILLHLFMGNFIFMPLWFSLFILVSSSWHMEQGSTLFRLNPVQAGCTWVLALVTGLLAFWIGLPAIVVPLALLLLFLLVGHLIGGDKLPIKRALYTGMMWSMIAGLVILFLTYPLSFSLPVLILLSGVVFMNQRLYLFLIRIRGMFFALAAIPFQIFYYLYSVAAFGFVGGNFFWDQHLKPRMSKSV